ncbi:hypothetical protein ABDK75_02775 [Gluconobacter sp. OJA]|uniref:phosphorylase family protein n=1 Tax=Gluconobacter sp. OJA TaxID=3145197 RepID=UPI0031F72A48
MENFDILIIFPLEEEFDNGVGFFSEITDVDDDHYVIFKTIIPDTDISVALIKQNDMGKGACRDTLEYFLRKYEVKLIISAGIGGGISKDMNIGDVCFSRHIFDVTDNAKIDGASEGQLENLLLSNTPHKVSSRISPSISRFKSSPKTKNNYVKWSQDCGDRGRVLIPNAFPGRDKEETIQNPKAIEGDIACGLVSSSPSYNKKLKGITRRISVLDTESGALGSVCEQHNIPGLVFRGVSDYAQADKNSFELATDNKARNIAIHNVMSLIFIIFESDLFKSRILRLREADKEIQKLSTTSNQIGGGLDNVTNCISDLCEEYNLKIKDLTPQIKISDYNYKLPTPRITIESDEISFKSKNFTFEVRDVVKKERILTIEIPKDYPDKSLPYIFASDLLNMDVDGKNYLPYVIDASEIKPPKGGILSKIPKDVSEAMTAKDTQSIIIMENFPNDYVSRAKYIANKMEEYPQFKFIIVCRGKFDPGVLGQFKSLGAKTSNLIDISFREIAYFIKNNFDLDNAQSEFVATRLGEIFDEFNMCSHPSYFAGIPRDALNSLMKANKKAEFIEIATAGYLSFLVATDDQDVALGRKAREDFLALLAYGMNFNGKKYTENNLIEMASEFAKEFDFGINSIKFVNSFMDRGLLFKDNGFVKFTLPFMESFLLAKYLTNNKEDAIKYFNLNSDSFNIDAFVIYSELGIDDKIVDSVILKLSNTIENLKKSSGPEESNLKLLGQVISSPSFEKMANAKAFDEKITELENDVIRDTDLSIEKQRILDLKRIIQKEAAGSSRKILSSPEIPEKDEEFFYANDILKIAQLMIASGAERLSAYRKREIISKIIDAGSLIFNIRSNRIVNTDFSQIRKNIIESDEISKIIDTDSNREEVENVINSVIDIQEMLIKFSPFISLISGLCDNARSNVLPESVINTSFDDKFKNFIVNFWVCDLSVKRGNKLLSASIKSLPKNISLRMVIAMFIMTRVYWCQHNRSDRQDLISIAKLSLSSAGMKMDPRTERQLFG